MIQFKTDNTMCSYHVCSAVRPNCERKSKLKKLSFNKVLSRALTLVLLAYKSTCQRYSLFYKTVELNSASGSFLYKEYNVTLINKCSTFWIPFLVCFYLRIHAPVGLQVVISHVFYYS